MSRSSWKGPFVDNATMQKLIEAQNLTLRTWSRRSVILPEFVGNTVDIHSGNSFTKLKITEDMIGHKFGEFAFTRKRHIRKTKKGK